MEDVNERAKESWKADTTSRERVKQVLEGTTEPAKASDIAERALVSEPTARGYLDELVDDGIAVETVEGRTTYYERNEPHFVDRRIRRLRSERTHEELLDGIRGMKTELRNYRERYGVESPEDLALELEAGEEGWGDVGRWRATRRNLAIAKAALQVSEAHRIAEA